MAVSSTIYLSVGRRAGARWSGAMPAAGLATLYLSLVVLIPLAAVVVRAFSQGGQAFMQSLAEPSAWAALRLTLGASLAVAAINAVMGTLIAWVLVRDEFGGKRIVNALIDLPFALPTIVAGLTLLTLYGPHSALHVNLAYSLGGVMAALLFVTLPFVVRAVQPVLMELDADLEAAAKSLGASQRDTFLRIILPPLLPAVLSGVALAFARAMGEFGALVLISGNIPFKTESAPVHIFGQIESGDELGAAALSVVLLCISLAVLVGLNRAQAWANRHAE